MNDEGSAEKRSGLDGPGEYTFIVKGFCTKPLFLHLQLDELVAEILHRAVDQLAAVVGGDDFYSSRQTAFQLIELCLDRRNGLRA